jgi:hypothetical protein
MVFFVTRFHVRPAVEKKCRDFRRGRETERGCAIRPAPVDGIRIARDDGPYDGEIAETSRRMDINERSVSDQVIGNLFVLQSQMERRPSGEAGLIVDVRAGVYQQMDDVFSPSFNRKLQCSALSFDPAQRFAARVYELWFRGQQTPNGIEVAGFDRGE